MSTLYYSTKAATLTARVLDEDDDLVLDMDSLEGAVHVGGLNSKQAGHASKLLADLVADHGKGPISVVAWAESGDHERLRALYARFGFESVGVHPSLMVRPADR